MKYFLIGFTCVIAIAFIVVVGLAVSPTCTQRCDQRPAYWFYMPIPYTHYTTVYNVSSSGRSLPPIEEEPSNNHAPSSGSEEHPVEPVEPHVVPPVEEPHIVVPHGRE
jgi:hypothetical protein